MVLKLYGLTKCTTCQKALEWLDEHKIAHSFSDVKDNPITGEQVAEWAQEHAARFSRRFEVSGETAFCYVDDAQPLLAHLNAQGVLRYLHRPANLEDVFLKLTGREMRE